MNREDLMESLKSLSLYGVLSHLDELEDEPWLPRLIEIERRETGTTVYLGASKKMSEQEWNMAETADLYFERWPKQELNFRDVNEATKFKKVKGFGKQSVQNIAVTTKLDKLVGRERRTQARIAGQTHRLTLLESNRVVQEQTLQSSKGSKET